MDLENQHTDPPYESWEKELQSYKEEIQDLKMLYKTIAEHNSTIENELELKNEEITNLIQQLRKYLSPQLYDLIVGRPEKASLQYQRKFLTIFFSDIVGFTEISNETDPEILSSALNDYLNDMAQIAMRYGGTIDKFIGDAIMIFFGDPEYQDDRIHARDCCRMALEMRHTVKRIDQHWVQKGISQGLKVRMGIHSGYCTVGNFGSKNRMDYTIIGGNVNIASRLESLADPNAIVLSSVTKNLLNEDYISHFKHSIQIKGIHHPVEVHELLAYKPSEMTDNDPLVAIKNDGFVIDRIEYDQSIHSPEKLQSIEAALLKILAQIESLRT
ncbi:MAG TPA: adenylate/guanylate cyclase domain-containing protein [Membranihabitans sp.]|nr:adenylate/guanylate cyclase domain-containing protein [Membranihabitans sp.]